MKKCEGEQKRWKAVYTVETAILMGILLPVLAGILWISILLYEKGVLQGAVSQNVLLENMKEEKKSRARKNHIEREASRKSKIVF